MTLSDLIRIMFRASQAEYGLLLRVSDPKRALQAFARAREDAASNPEASPDAALPPVQFRELIGHPEGNLAIGPPGRLGPPSNGGGGHAEPLDEGSLF